MMRDRGTGVQRSMWKGPQSAMILRRNGMNAQAVALLLVAGGLIGSMTCVEPAAAASFCAPRTIRSYAPPLKKMRPVARPPAGGVLPSGAGGVKLRVLGGGITQVGGGRIGVYLEGPSGHRAKLDAVLSSRLVVVNQRGRPMGAARERERRVKTILSPSRVDLGFGVGGAPRLYRMDVQARDFEGMRLWSYSEYIRVVPRTVKARLGLSAGSYNAGDVVLFRLENAGSAEILFGYEFALEVWNGSSWSISPGATDSFEQIGLGIGGGHTERCQRLQLPANLAAGRYRISKPYSARLKGPSREVRAIFDVV
jgi:hypothetical protein